MSVRKGRLGEWSSLKAADECHMSLWHQQTLGNFSCSSRMIFLLSVPLHLGTWEVGFAPDGSPFTGWKRLPTLLCGNTFCGDYRWLTACPSGSGNFQAAEKELPHRGWADDFPSLLLTELVGPGWTWQASWTKEHTTAYMTHTVLNIHSVLT